MSLVRSGSLLITLARISRILATKKTRGYIVGGFIRDWLLGRETNDIDIAVVGAAPTIAREIAKEVAGRFVLLDQANDIARVVMIEDARPGQESRGPEWHFDFSTLAGDIESDLARREMLADWRGAGKALGTPDTAAWYTANRENMILHEDTRAWIEKELGLTNA